jgi:O-antigen ligase
MGFLVAEAPGPIVAGLLVTAALVLPPWMLLISSIILAHVLPGYTLVGALQGPDIALLLYLIRWSAMVLARGRAGFQDRRVVLILALSVGWWWISLILSGSTGTALALTRITLYATVFAAATSEKGLGRALLAGVAVYAAIEAALSLVGVTLRVEGRLAGTYGDPGIFGLLMLAGIAAAGVLPRPMPLIARSLTIPALILTLTRGAWIAVAVSLLTIAWPHVNRRMVRLAAAGALVLALSWWLVPLATTQLGLDPRSLPIRVASWRAGLELAADEPITGHGWALGERFYSSGQPQPFNTWINVAASSGVIGAVILGAFVLRLLRILSRSEETVARSWFAYLAGFLTLSLGEMTIYATSPATILFFVLTGAVVASTPGFPQVVTRGRTLGRRAAWPVSSRGPNKVVRHHRRS